MVKAQEWLDKNYPKEKRGKIKELDISDEELEGELKIEGFIDLEDLECNDNKKLTKLKLSNLPKLGSVSANNCQLTSIEIEDCPKTNFIDAENNKLSKLEISSCSNLVSLNCSNNELTELDIKKCSNLCELDCHNNQLTELDLTGNNKIYSLECGNLWIAIKDIEGSILLGDITTGGYSNVSIRLNKSDCATFVSKIPSEFLEISEIIKENYEIKEVNYEKVYPKILFDEKLIANSLFLEEFPIKLFNIKIKEVEEAKKNPEIKNYAILSYVWGNPGEVTNDILNIPQYKNKLNPSGYKSLYKAFQTCKLLGIDYLWIDQLCIDQNSVDEKNQEVPKMGKYYSNSSVTLIAIHANVNIIKNNKLDLLKIIELIIKSEWFTRSWTFQEGFLSKHTIFMFDNYLVDGRVLSSAWAIKQTSSENIYNNLGEFSESQRKIATPLGQTFCRIVSSGDTRPTLSLCEALMMVRKRKRYLPIDGIYSILGLLPYGDQTIVKYKEKLCKHTMEEQINKNICQHNEEEKKDPVYSKGEVKKVLLDVMKIAVKSGYSEPLFWHGLGSGWLPEVDEKGSTNVVNVEKEIQLDIGYNFGDINLKSNDDIEVAGSKYTVKNLGSVSPVLDDTGLYVRNARLEFVDECGKLYDKQFCLKGIYETTKTIEIGDILLLPNKALKIQNVYHDFCLVLIEKNGGHIRKGLVKFFPQNLKDYEFLKEAKKEKFIISATDLEKKEETVSEKTKKDSMQTQIQIPPK